MNIKNESRFNKNERNIIKENLYAVLEEEVSKEPSERDLDLIMECSNLLQELTTSQELSEEERRAGLQRIYDKYKAEKQNQKNLILDNCCKRKEHSKSDTFKKKRRSRIGLVLLPVAVFLCLCFTLVIASATQDLTVREILLSVMDQFNMLNPGESIEDGNITVIKGDEMSVFSSMEEAAAHCSFDCMFPKVLPSGVYVEKIIEAMSATFDYKIIMFTTNTDNISIRVNDRITIDPATWENTQVYQTKRITFTIIEFGEERQAVGVCDGKEYVIYCQGIDESDFLMILDGMSE